MDFKENKLVLDPASNVDGYLLDFMRRGLESRERFEGDKRTVGEDKLKTRVIDARQSGSQEPIELSAADAGLAATAIRITIELERMKAGAMYRGEQPDGMGTDSLMCRMGVSTIEEFSRGERPVSQE